MKLKRYKGKTTRKTGKKPKFSRVRPSFFRDCMRDVELSAREVVVDGFNESREMDFQLSQIYPDFEKSRTRRKK